MSTPILNPQITDAVTQTNVPVNKETPAEELAKLEQAAQQEAGQE